MFSGAYFNGSIKDAFPEDITIEDLWLPFYCVSTDISTSTERVHRFARTSITGPNLTPQIRHPVAVCACEHELRLDPAAHL